jgi:hypothetical protein
MEGVGPIYRASYKVQRGSGIGSYLGGLFRIIRPLFIKGLKTVGRETLKTAGNVLTDISLKKPEEKIGNIVKKNVQQTVDRHMQQGGGLLKRKRSIIDLKRKIKKKKAQSSLRRRRRVKPVLREKRDIFD